ncbi:MAG: glycoside hydrolase family 2 TIM barrel-domain containing protein [Clostridia bacterium]
MKKYTLNFDWKYSETFEDSFLQKDFNDSKFEDINIPHCNRELPFNNFDEGLSQFVSTYRKKILITAEQLKKRLVLEFKAAANFAEVFINGKFAFAHKGSYTAFSGEINEFLQLGENTIAVKLDSTERPEIPPFGNVIDYLVYGGIYREVFLYEYDDIYIKNVHISPINVLGKPRVNAKIFLNKTAKVRAVIELVDMQNNVVKKVEAALIEQDNIVEFDASSITLWDIDNPVLYTLKITLDNAETWQGKFGFRDCKFTKKGFYLNGKPLKIRGLNRHQSFPYVGNAMPASAQFADAEFLKNNLGVNLVRTSHYPNSEHFLNRCDELGLLVFTEIPAWQHVSKLPEWRDICCNHVTEMINEDFNHPSIILWGVRINESIDDDELYTKTNLIAHSLDTTRQTGGVRCIPHSHFLEDVYTYNDFIHSGKKMALLPKPIVCGNVPYLVTEHNGHMFPTKSFDHEKKRQEHALRHARVLNKMYASKGISGVIGWCMSDYNTHKDFGSGDKVCYHGVSDMFRIEKTAAYVYKAQQNDYPVLELTSNMEIGDTAGGKDGDVYMFTNCDTVNLYKNNELINTFDIKNEISKNKNFKHMPHPPILLYDIIGNQIEKNEKYSVRDAKKIKSFLLDIKAKGTFGGIAAHLLTALKMLVKYKDSIDTITNLFGKYATNWGSKQVSYKFVGAKGDKTVEVEKSAVTTPKLYAQADCLTLTQAYTYDTTRVVIKALSQTGNVLPYSNDVITLTATGGISIIGEQNVALIGGVRGVWVKTNGDSNKGKLVIESKYLGKETILFDINKIDVPSC